MQLTPCQEKAQRAIDELLLGSNQFLILDGEPGVGKTFLMKALELNDINAKRELCNLSKYRSLSLTATTNEAVLQLTEKGEFLRTIYSLLGIKVKQNHRTGEEDIHLPHDLNDKLEELNALGTIIIVDEASMLGKKMVDMFINVFTKFPDIKVIFSLDSYQLLPVKESNIPILDHGIRTVLLKTPVRFKADSDIYKLTQHLRECIDNQSFPEIDLLKGCVEFIQPEHQPALLKDLSLKDESEYRLLAFTNKTVDELNIAIRVFQDKSPNFQVNDVAVLHNHLIPQMRTGMSQNMGTKITLGEDFGLIHARDKLPVGMKILSTTTNKEPLYRELPFDVLHDKSTNNLYAYDAEYLRAELKKLYSNNNYAHYFALKNSVGELRFPYASTVHKAQGKSMPTVAIFYQDLYDSIQYSGIDMFLRLLLVAVSRAKEKVYICL